MTLYSNVYQLLIILQLCLKIVKTTLELYRASLKGTAFMSFLTKMSKLNEINIWMPGQVIFLVPMLNSKKFVADNKGVHIIEYKTGKKYQLSTDIII